METGASRRRAGRGVTLVELMIALTIIAISLFGILSMVVHSMAMREAARESVLAKEWVQKKLEEVKSQKFTDLKTSAYPPAGLATVYSASFTSAGVPAQLPNATGQLTIDYSNVNLVEVIASIDWKGRLGKGTYSMRSLYAK